MTEASGPESGTGRGADGRRHPPHDPPRPRLRPPPQEGPPWLPLAAAAVLMWWPVTFVLGLLGPGIWLLVVSIMLAVLAVPALVVLLVRADRRSKAAARRRLRATGR